MERVMIEPIIPKKLLIEVTREDVTEGSPGSAYNCPIALAARRTLKDFGTSVSVYLGMVHLQLGITKYNWVLDSDLMESLHEFDSDRTFTAIGQHVLKGVDTWGEDWGID
jgi:hypothetical protein